jgi:HAD superfamily hydrolase (TIGR01549 family)
MIFSSPSQRDRKFLLICDLDNTLYDWVSYFVPSFYAMVDSAISIMDCDREILLNELRGVHRKHHNTEHPFALLETETYQNWSVSKGANSPSLIDPAFHAFNIARKSSLKLYDGVEESFVELKRRNVTIVGYSDSEYYGVVDRVKRLGLDRYLSRVFCTPRAKLRKKPFGTKTEFQSPIVVEHEFKQKKPNPNALRNICKEFDVAPNQTVYIGDSISKDVVMADEANVFSSWAKYGTEVNAEYYNKLVRVSHWTSVDVQRERELSANAKGIVPQHICSHSFSEVLELSNLGSQRGFFRRIVGESRFAFGLN